MSWAFRCGIRRGPAINDEHKRLFYRQFELYLEAGLGTLGATEPVVELNFSNDGGKTWASAGYRSAGTEGAYKTRVLWKRLRARTPARQ